MTHHFFFFDCTGDQSKMLFKCPTCPKVYKHSTSLIKHRKYECGMEPQFICPNCPYRAKQRNNLKKHILNMHFDVLSNT